MSWKRELDFMSGYVFVTVKAIKDDEFEDEQEVQFTFLCYVGEELNSYDKLDCIERVAHDSAKLQGYYNEDIIDVKEVCGAVSKELADLLNVGVGE